MGRRKHLLVTWITPIHYDAAICYWRIEPPDRSLRRRKKAGLNARIEGGTRGPWGQVACSLCFRTIASVAVFLLWVLASAAAQPSSDADRCKSIEVRGTSVPLDEAVAACTAIIDSGRESSQNLAEIHVCEGQR